MIGSGGRTGPTFRTGRTGSFFQELLLHAEGMSVQEREIRTGRTRSDGTDWRWMNFGMGEKQTGHANRCMPGYIKSKLRLLVKTECDRNVVPYVYGMAVHLTGGKFLLQGTDRSYSFLVKIGVFTTSHLNFTDRTILGNDE